MSANQSQAGCGWVALGVQQWTPCREVAQHFPHPVHWWKVGTAWCQSPQLYNSPYPLALQRAYALKNTDAHIEGPWHLSHIHHIKCICAGSIYMLISWCCMYPCISCMQQPGREEKGGWGCQLPTTSCRRTRCTPGLGRGQIPCFSQNATREAVAGINSHHHVTRPDSTARSKLLGSQPLQYHPEARKLFGIVSACHLVWIRVSGLMAGKLWKVFQLTDKQQQAFSGQHILEPQSYQGT